MNISQLPDRIRRKILVEDCWIWMGSVNKQTHYGKVGFNGTTFDAHRLVYTILVGPVPSKKELHHKCSNRGCCNPSHLQAVTVSEHRKLEPRPGNRFAHGNGWENRTHCKHGHPFDEQNTRWQGRIRICRTCKRQTWAKNAESTNRKRRLKRASALFNQ